MKKIILFTFLTFITFILTSCSSSMSYKTYTVTYTGNHHLTHEIINSVSDIKYFYKDYNTSVGLDDIQDETNSNYDEVMSSYTEDFFKENSLIFIIIETNNSNDVYKITEHYAIDDTYHFTFEKKTSNQLGDDSCSSLLYIITIEKISSDLNLEIEVK